MTINDFSDIHTHNLKAGRDAIINLPLGTPLPPDGYFSVGIHPWDTPNVSSDDIKYVEKLASDPRIIAIGETGLDKRQGAPLDLQEKIFLQHVKISEDTHKPLIIHAVGTFNELINLRNALRPTQRWIIHGFRGKPQTAQQLLDHGFDISIGKKFNPDTINIIPVDRLFHETD